MQHCKERSRLRKIINMRFEKANLTMQVIELNSITINNTYATYKKEKKHKIRYVEINAVPIMKSQDGGDI